MELPEDLHERASRIEDPLQNTFRKEIEGAINNHGKSDGSNTPDFILAEYLSDCLEAFDKTVNSRDQWYGIAPEPGWREGETPGAKAERLSERITELEDESADLRKRRDEIQDGEITT